MGMIVAGAVALVLVLMLIITLGGLAVIVKRRLGRSDA